MDYLANGRDSDFLRISPLNIPQYPCILTVQYLIQASKESNAIFFKLPCEVKIISRGINEILKSKWHCSLWTFGSNIGWSWCTDTEGMDSERIRSPNRSLCLKHSRRAILCTSRRNIYGDSFNILLIPQPLFDTACLSLFIFAVASILSCVFYTSSLLAYNNNST